MTRAETGGDPERILVLGTVGARPRARRGRRRVPAAEGGGEDPALVPSVRATVIRAAALSADEAEAWLDRLRRDRDELEAEALDGAAELNAVLRAHRAAVADPYVRDVAPLGATVVRVGHGRGDQVADGRFESAVEVPPPSPRSRIRRRADALAPDERLAAVLGRREPVLACEELVLRARADIDAERPREAALQARVALEAALAELGTTSASRTTCERSRRSAMRSLGRPMRRSPARCRLSIRKRSRWPWSASRRRFAAVA